MWLKTLPTPVLPRTERSSQQKALSREIGLFFIQEPMERGQRRLVGEYSSPMPAPKMHQLTAP